MARIQSNEYNLAQLNNIEKLNNDYFLKTIQSNSNGDFIDTDNPLPVELPPCICEENSSSTPLLADATFTGTPYLTNGYGIIYINVYSDVASATDGLIVEQSTDGTNWDFDDVYTIPANTGKTFSIQPAGRYIRVKYVNGDTDQTEFRLQTVMKNNGLDSSHRVQDNLNDDDDGRLRLSVLKLRTAANTYVSGTATATGNFKISLEELESGVSSNSNSQLNVTPFHADGTEGALLSGVNYVSGKSGIDSATETLQSITYEHHEIHSGSHYNICDYITGLGLNDTVEFVVTTPNTTSWTHLVFNFSFITGGNLVVYEGASGITGGTTVTPFNNDRNSSNTSGLTIVQDPASITSDGTKIAGHLAGAGRMGGTIERDNEIILKQNTIYLFRFTSTATSNALDYCAEWYEHTNKN